MPSYNLSVGNLALREAELRDVDDCYSLYVDFLAASVFPYATVKLDERIREYISNFITSPNELVLLLVNKEDQPVGILVASIVDLPVFLYKYVADILWFVREEGRTGRAPFRMLEAMEFWGKEKGCAYSKIGLFANLSRKLTKRMNKIYRNKGYYPLDTSYFKELN